MRLQDFPRNWIVRTFRCFRNLPLLQSYVKDIESISASNMPNVNSLAVIFLQQNF